MRSRGGVSKNSYVDEALFGNGKKSSKQATVITTEELRTIRGKTESNNQTDAVIISASDLARIKGATVIKTKDQQQ
jgi:hypothetical protein